MFKSVLRKMNSYNIISYLRRGYFIFPPGMFEKRLAELLLAKKTNSSSRDKDTFDKFKRMIAYTLSHGKLPSDDIKEFEHINLDNECSKLDQNLVKTLAAKKHISLEGCTKEICKKLTDKIFGLERTAIENLLQQIHRETAILIEKRNTINSSSNDINKEIRHLSVHRVVVFRPTWPPESRSNNGQQDSNNYKLGSNKEDEKNEKNRIQPIILTTTTASKQSQGIPPISIDHRVILEPYIDIYADQDEDVTILVQNRSIPTEINRPTVAFKEHEAKLEATHNAHNNLKSTVNKPEKIRMDLIVYSDEKSASEEIKQAHYFPNLTKRDTRSDKLNIMPQVTVKSESAKPEPSGIPNSFNIDTQDFDPFKIKEATLKNETPKYNKSKTDSLNKNTKKERPTKCDKSNFTNISTKEESTQLSPPKLDLLKEEIPRLDPLREDKKTLETNKPETCKDLETISQPISPSQKRWLEIINRCPKPKTMRLDPLKVEIIKVERNGSKKAENWKDFEKIAVPVSALQESSMPNLTNYDLKLKIPKLDTLDPLREGLTREHKKNTPKSGSRNKSKITITKIQPVKVERVKIQTFEKTEPEIHDTSISSVPTSPLQEYPKENSKTLKQETANAEAEESDVDAPKRETKKPRHSRAMQVGKANPSLPNVTVFAAHPVHQLVTSALPPTRKTTTMDFLDSIMLTITKKIYKQEHNSSDIQNQFTKQNNGNTGNERVEVKESSEKTNIIKQKLVENTDSSLYPICALEDNVSRSEKEAIDLLKKEEFHPLEINKEIETGLKPDSAVNDTKAKTMDMDMDDEIEDVDPYIFPTETKTIRVKDDKMEHTDSASTTAETNKVEENNGEKYDVVTDDVEQESVTPEYKPEYRPEAYAISWTKKQTDEAPQGISHKYYPPQCCYYINSQNFYQQCYQRYFLGLAEHYRHSYEPKTNRTIATAQEVEAKSTEEVVVKPAEKLDAEPAEVVVAKPAVEFYARPAKELDAKPSKEIDATPSMEIYTKPTHIFGNSIYSQNVYQQSYQRYFFGLAEHYRRTNKPITNQTSAITHEVVAQPAEEFVAKPVNDLVATPAEEIDAKPTGEIDTQPAQVLGDKPVQIINVKTAKEFDLKPVIDSSLKISHVRPEKLMGRGTRSRAEHVLKKRLPVETSTHRQFRNRRKNKHNNKSVSDKLSITGPLSQPRSTPEHEEPLSVVLERVRTRNRIEYCQLYKRLNDREQPTTKKSGRDKSPPAPPCPSSETPSRSPPMSFPPKEDRTPKFCPPRKITGSKFFDVLSRLSVYDNDNPSERPVTASKQRELKKHLLGQKGVNKWILVHDQARPFNETENILECSKESREDNSFWFQNLQLLI